MKQTFKVVFLATARVNDYDICSHIRESENSYKISFIGFKEEREYFKGNSSFPIGQCTDFGYNLFYSFIFNCDQDLLEPVVNGIKGMFRSIHGKHEDFDLFAFETLPS